MINKVILKYNKMTLLQLELLRWAATPLKRHINTLKQSSRISHWQIGNVQLISLMMFWLEQVAEWAH